MYKIKHLSHHRHCLDPNAWIFKGHTFTIISPETENHSMDQLYVNHHHIHKDNWKWVYPRSQLVWKQGSGEDHLAGHIGFRADGVEAAGSMQFGNKRETVALTFSHHTSCTTSSATAEACKLKVGSGLALQDLLGMNQYSIVDNNTVDEVKKKSMEDFYKILQYYMDPKYLHNFITPNPPDLGDIAAIAKDDDATNRQWYSTLSVPYLVQTLSTSSSPAAVKLNVRRAQNYMKNATAVSTTFKDQSAQLYARQWKIKFPKMLTFLNDEDVYAQHHNAAIDTDARIGLLK